MNELTNSEKIKLGHEAFESFFAQFGPLDECSAWFLEVIFEMLMGKD